ncbi:MAG: polyprenyl synthetase family protein [Acidobacteriota bacterium]
MDRYMPAARSSRLAPLIRDYPQRGGKKLRPCLLIASARSFGASVTQAIRAAVALELLHNALLIHDDIQDFSQERRGLPALHQLYGSTLALGAGDALALHSLKPLMECPSILGPVKTMRLLREVERMSRETAEGQALELGWRRDNLIIDREADYYVMVLKKTCWFSFIYPLRAGALIGEAAAAELETLTRFGFFLGTAFQIQDDLLNLLGDGRQYGKEIDGDLREGKRSLMLVHLYRVAQPNEKARLSSIFRKSPEQRTDSDIQWVRRRMEAAGSFDYAQGIAGRYAGAASHEFEAAFSRCPPSRDRDFIEAMVRWAIRRNK